MGNMFAGSEIVELAIQVEMNGRDFYNAAAGRAKLDKPKELFKFLAKEEEKHIMTFEKLLDKVEKYSPAEVYSDEYVAYMNALASEHIFTDKNRGAEAAGKAGTDLEAVEMGIKFEKDSIVFYEGMRRMVPDHEREIVDEIVRQEQVHLVKLSEIKSVL